MTSVSCFYSGTIAPRTITGGDRHGLEVWSAWSARGDCDLRVYTSYWGRELIQGFGYPLRTATTENAPSAIGPSRLGYLQRFLKAFRAALRAPRVDVAYAASPYFYDIVPAVALKLRARARMIVALFHLIPPPWRRTGSLAINTMAWIEQRTMLWFVKHFADRIVVDNEELVKDLTALGIPRERIVLSPMGIREMPPMNGAMPTPQFDAVYVGRLAGPKGVPGLISAWKDVVAALPHAKLALVGNNEVAFDAQKLVDEAGLSDSIQIFLGLDDENVRKMLARSKTFITGSLEEGYGLSVLEALAAGLPCITFDIPAFREAFPTGRYAADSFQYPALARAAIRVLSDEALQEQLRAQIRERVTIRTWPQIASELWKTCVGR